MEFTESNNGKLTLVLSVIQKPNNDVPLVDNADLLIEMLGNKRNKVFAGMRGCLYRVCF